MKQRDRDFMACETKKEYIIRIAQKDPFLKIEEIADFAGTTQRYVRTILSEANLSLMLLREEYARKMEKSTQPEVIFSLKDSLFDIHLHAPDVCRFSYGLPQAEMIECSLFSFKGGDCRQFFCYTQHIYYGEKPFGLSMVISLTRLTDRQAGQRKPLLRLMELASSRIQLWNPEIETGRLTDLFAGKMMGCEFPPDLPMIKVSTLICEGDQILGEQVFCFSAEYVKIKIAGIFNPILEISDNKVIL